MLTLVASTVFLLVSVLSAPKPAVRPKQPLARLDSAAERKRGNTMALAEMQEFLQRTLLERGYDLTNPNVIEMVKHLIVDALPARIEGRSDEELLQSEIDFVHKAHWGATANRDHAHHHPHHA